MSSTTVNNPTRFGRADNRPVEWAHSTGLVSYESAVAAMEVRAAAIAEGAGEELVWLLEHPPLYTAGVSAEPRDLLQPERFPVFATRRGGRHTYHGPGQRVAYVMLDLNRRARDVRAFVTALEAWLIVTLAQLSVEAGRRPGRVGVWVGRDSEGGWVADEKIAAIGVKLRRWVSFHGVSLNVAPDLSHFAGIVPCGISDHGVTSLAALGKSVSMAEADAALALAFESVFGPIVIAPSPPGP